MFWLLVLGVHSKAYPFVGDGLVGPLLDGVEWWQGGGVDTGGGIASLGPGGTAGCGGAEVIQVQVLLISQVLLLQGFIQNVWMVPDLEGRMGETRLWSPTEGQLT